MRAQTQTKRDAACVMWLAAVWLISCERAGVERGVYGAPPASPTASVSATASPDGPAAVPQSSSATARITASPNPVPAGEAIGKTSISWACVDGPDCAVYVTRDADTEVLLGTGSEGSSIADWIQTGSAYQFQLYSDQQRSKLLGSVTVTRARH